MEKRKTARVIDRLGFGQCRLSIALPKNTPYRSVQDLNHLRIATTYSHIFTDFLTANNIQADVHEVSGAVELAPSLGLADAIFDIVSTGSTLLANGLYEVETVLRSEALLLAGLGLAPGKTGNSRSPAVSYSRQSKRQKPPVYPAQCAQRPTGNHIPAAARHEKSHRIAAGDRRLEQPAQCGARRRVLGSTRTTQSRRCTGDSGNTYRTNDTLRHGTNKLSGF